jgi:Rieske 2Fe-2S protein
MAEDFLRLDVHEQIECAHTLASRFYIDPVILEIEKEKIFRRTWQLAGTLSQPCGEMNGAPRTIADPETFFTADVAGEPIVIVRDKEGTLRAFSNVCRHRAGRRAHRAGQWLQECSALRLSRLDVHARWSPNWHTRCGGRGVFRPQHHGHGAAAAGDLGAVHLRQL